MTPFVEVLKVSGSNIGPVLSATALAVTTTVGAPPYSANRYEPVPMERTTSRSPAPTDLNFAVGHNVLDDGWGGLVAGRKTVVGEAVDAAPAIVVPFPVRSPSQFMSLTLGVPPSPKATEASMAASSFYNELPQAAKSSTLWDIVQLFHLARAPEPSVEVIDGEATTVDFNSEGRLLSILIDKDACHLSSFTKNKELKMTYFLEEGGSKEELTDVLWTQLQSFRTPVEV